MAIIGSFKKRAIGEIVQVQHWPWAIEGEPAARGLILREATREEMIAQQAERLGRPLTRSEKEGLPSIAYFYEASID